MEPNVYHLNWETIVDLVGDFCNRPFVVTAKHNELLPHEDKQQISLTVGDGDVGGTGC